MSQLVPHLLLRTDRGTSQTAAMLRSAGYMVSKIHDDAIIETPSSSAESIFRTSPPLNAKSDFFAFGSKVIFNWRNSSSLSNVRCNTSSRSSAVRDSRT